jgi:hypothetical protein
MAEYSFRLLTDEGNCERFGVRFYEPLLRCSGFTPALIRIHGKHA